jgi:hypothetical protein
LRVSHHARDKTGYASLVTCRIVLLRDSPPHSESGSQEGNNLAAARCRRFMGMEKRGGRGYRTTVTDVVVENDSPSTRRK